MNGKWVIAAVLALGVAGIAEASDQGARAQRLDQEGWQIVSDDYTTCIPMHAVFHGIASPQELDRQIPPYTGQPLRIQYSSPDMALFLDDSGDMGPQMLIRGKDRCMSFLKWKRNPK